MRFIFAFFVFADLCIYSTLAADCACATTAVHVRDGAGTTHNTLTTLATGHCLTFKGQRQTVAGDSWVNVDYNGRKCWIGQDGWIHEGYVHIQACAGSGSPASSAVQLPGCPHIVTRHEWGARSPTRPHTLLTHTPKYMFIHHGATPFCHTKAECTQMVKSAQNYHMDGHGYSDIEYSFLVGEDGNVYEGRGWDAVGAHTLNYNSVGLAICVIGDFTNRLPNDAALNAVKQLVQCAHDNHKITATYMLRGHRDVGATACPGNKLYELIKTWPHY
ncbi:peptidoglycan-recognition protein SC2-like isoform X3 [Dreissena polymorpha]|nr:peptidoglycan-recognition protein SC2-like isoform X3 [Dreissena polymorpha]